MPLRVGRPMLHVMAPDDTADVIDQAIPPGAALQRSPATRVLIVDADRRVRQSLAGLIELAPGMEVAGVASDGSAALAMIVERSPDMAVIDPCLPEVDAGLELIMLLHERFPDLTLVAMHCSDAMEHPALANGATTFLPKSGQPEELVEALRAAAAARAPMISQLGPTAPDAPADTPTMRPGVG